MKDNKLEIGDKLYCIQYGGIQKITIVDRLTAKTAFCGTSKFNLELENSKAKLIGGGTYSQKYYILETEELISKYKKSMLVKILSSTNFDKFPLGDLENVSKILKVNI